jgi:cytochrome c556
MKLLKLIGHSLVLASTLSSPAFANDTFEKSEDAIEYRKKAFSMIHFQFSNMGDMIKGKKPFDLEQFQIRASNTAALSLMPWEAFIVGSDEGKTDALPNIWKNSHDFNEKIESFKADSKRLLTAAKNGNVDTIRPAFMNLAKNCKGCHQSFKKD